MAVQAIVGDLELYSIQKRYVKCGITSIRSGEIATLVLCCLEIQLIGDESIIENYYEDVLISKISKFNRFLNELY